MSVFKNSDTQYSLAAKLFHWLTAVAVVFLFALGLWMTDLDYYDDWYRKGPNLHIGLGVLLALFTLMRLIYRGVFAYPKPIDGHKHVQLAAKLVHMGFYGLLLTLFITGYVIVTIEGEALSVFGLVDVPSLYQVKGNLQDTLGKIHEVIAKVLIVLAIAHGGAALWHHFKVRDNTLRRMITKSK